MEPRLRTRPAHDDPSPAHPDSALRGERSTWTQRSLRMRKWISMIGVLLCVFVTVLFVRQDAISQATAFGVIGLISLAYLGWTVAIKAR